MAALLGSRRMARRLPVGGEIEDDRQAHASANGAFPRHLEYRKGSALGISGEKRGGFGRAATIPAP